MSAEIPIGEPPKDEELVALSDRLRKDVITLASEIGPRSIFVPEALLASRMFLEERFQDLGYDVSLENFYVEPGRLGYSGHHIPTRYEVSNIFAEKKGREKPDEIVILGAHYDTPFDNVPGANDNGSGVAAMLEVARALKDVPTSKTLRFVSYTNEEPPFTWEKYMGSIISAKRSYARRENIVGMIALDEIGCFESTGESPISNAIIFKSHIPPIPANSIAFLSYGNGRELLDISVEEFSKHSTVPVEKTFGRSDNYQGFISPRISPHGWSDHFGYLALRYPAILITDTGPFRYGAYYHTPDDTPDKLDYKILASVTTGIGEVIKSLAT